MSDHFYRPSTKLWEVFVFSGVFLSTVRRGSSDALDLAVQPRRHGTPLYSPPHPQWLQSEVGGMYPIGMLSCVDGQSVR